MNAPESLDPEGFRREPASTGCICGPIYTYAGTPEPGQFAPDCPYHNPVTESLEALSERVLGKHQWYTVLWADGGRHYGWGCSCPIVRTGTVAENPLRFARYETPADAITGAVAHVASVLAAEVRRVMVEAAAVEALAAEWDGDPS